MEFALVRLIEVVVPLGEVVERTDRARIHQRSHIARCGAGDDVVAEHVAAHVDAALRDGTAVPPGAGAIIDLVLEYPGQACAG